MSDKSPYSVIEHEGQFCVTYNTAGNPPHSFATCPEEADAKLICNALECLRQHTTTKPPLSDPMRTLREKIPPVLTDPHLTILLRAIDGRHKKEVDELKRKIGLLRHHLQVSVGDTISVWAGDDLGIVQVPADEWYRASFGDE